MPWGLSGPEVFDKERLKVLIEKVVAYGADAMEIVWKGGGIRSWMKKLVRRAGRVLLIVRGL